MSRPSILLLINYKHLNSIEQFLKFKVRHWLRLRCRFRLRLKIKLGPRPRLRLRHKLRLKFKFRIKFNQLEACGSN